MTTKAKPQIEQEFISILDDMTKGWDLEFEGGITPQTRLIGDFRFESIEIVRLMVRIEQHFGLKKLASDRLLVRDGRHVPDLTVAQIAEFINKETNG